LPEAATLERRVFEVVGLYFKDAFHVGVEVVLHVWVEADLIDEAVVGGEVEG